MKYKKLTKEQIIISLDRLTRFKPTKEKYLRVFFDIIISNLLEPKYKKSELEKLDLTLIRNYVEEIFNGSIEFSNNTVNYNINHKLCEYENSVFVNDNATQVLLSNRINYSDAIQYIDEGNPVNLRWLKTLNEHNNIRELREEKSLKYPIEKVLLAEGLTEEILLPAFSKFLGYDFYKKGIHIIGAGGKNQVVKLYYKLSEELKLPIYLLLDRDAEENIRQISPRLRKTDRIHPIACGEFEDLLPKTLITRTINNHFENFFNIQEEELDSTLPMAKCLEELFKTKGLHEFKKAEFAKLVKENIFLESDVSSEIKNIIQEIFN